MTLGPTLQLPNHTQLTIKGVTNMLWERSHYLGCAFSFRTAKCAHTWECELPEPCAAVNTSTEDRTRSVKLDPNRPWHSNLTQHSQSQHGDMQASRHQSDMFPIHLQWSNSDCSSVLPSWSEDQTITSNRFTPLLCIQPPTDAQHPNRIHCEGRVRGFTDLLTYFYRKIHMHGLLSMHVYLTWPSFFLSLPTQILTHPKTKFHIGKNT